MSHKELSEERVRRSERPSLEAPCLSPGARTVPSSTKSSRKSPPARRNPIANDYKQIAYAHFLLPHNGLFNSLKGGEARFSLDTMKESDLAPIVAAFKQIRAISKIAVWCDLVTSADVAAFANVD